VKRAGLSGSLQARLQVARLIDKRPRLRRAASSVAHLVGSPHTFELAQLGCFTRSAATAIEALIGEGGDIYRNDYLSQRALLDHRLSQLDRAFPPEFGLGDETSEWMYSIVRHRRPDVVVEVGVADGLSSAVILAALDANGSGRLVSVDIDPCAGRLVGEHARWQLRIHHLETAGAQLEGLLDELGSIDLFFHDASHAYSGQIDDYVSGLAHLRTGGILLSDDVDWSWAFADICGWARVEPVILGAHWKAAGGFVVRNDSMVGRNERVR